MFKRIILPNVLTLFFHLCLIVVIMQTCGIHSSVSDRTVLLIPLVYFLFGFVLKATTKEKLTLWSVLALTFLLMVPMFVSKPSDAWFYLYLPFLSVLPSYDIGFSPAFLFLALCPSLFIWSGTAFKADNKKMLAAFGLLFLLFLGFIWVPQQNRNAIEIENSKIWREKTQYRELAVLQPNKQLPIGSFSIQTEDSKIHFENECSVSLPDIDMDNYYYVIFVGRKVKFDDGQIETVEALDSNTIVVYQVNKVI
ncbi:MAG: hypothetical protein ABRQ26_07120 [Syntrophomonadaceae bacterium]